MFNSTKYHEEAPDPEEGFPDPFEDMTEQEREDCQHAEDRLIFGDDDPDFWHLEPGLYDSRVNVDEDDDEVPEGEDSDVLVEMADRPERRRKAKAADSGRNVRPRIEEGQPEAERGSYLPTRKESQWT